MTRRHPPLSLPVLAAETAGNGQYRNKGGRHDSGRATDPIRRGADSTLVPGAPCGGLSALRQRARRRLPPQAARSGPAVRARPRHASSFGFYCDECGSGLRIDDRPRPPAAVPRQSKVAQAISGPSCSSIPAAGADPWIRNTARFLEDRCKKAGIAVHYCAEGLMDDQIAISTLVKSIKRAMVREYPRQLTDPRQPRRGLLKRGIAAGDCGSGLDRPAGQDTGPPKMRPAPTVRARHPNERMPDMRRYRSGVRLAPRQVCRCDSSGHRP